MDRYENLTNDLNHDKWKCELITLEICTRGLIDKENKSRITHICNLFKIKNINAVIATASKLALIGSRIIWNGRRSPEWNDNYNLE